MRYVFLLTLQLCYLLASGQPSDTGQQIAKGHLPVIMTDEGGRLHMVFGQDSTIYYTTAKDSRTQFGSSIAVATLPNLVAGAKRGPQLAVSDQFVVITAVNRMGDLFAYSLDRSTGKWSPAVRMNDVPAIAKEGFHAVSGAGQGVFHTAWLDLRNDKRNKIMGATSRDGGRSWSANQVIYHSPDGTVCECCKVSIKAKDNDVFVQFRNWLGGSRDIYLTHSSDGGSTYATAQKLGTGTWKLNACPMDGGSVVLSSTGQPLTTWRRENTLYTCVPGQAEKAIATGRNVTAADGVNGAVLAWDEGGTVWMKADGESPVALGKGQMPSLAIGGQTVVCVWEADGQVMMRAIPLTSK
jgi:hypothetical protein